MLNVKCIWDEALFEWQTLAIFYLPENDFNENQSWSIIQNRTICNSHLSLNLI